ncbi:proteasome subunit beta type-3-A [Dunaliella salina]|uniref:Proteasome subunit beta type-3-A n=1 Tax=Dunaliella salina TaxID=3046 RepID=A0ABQ7G5N8_DUNSA|nr:proteasome subunit beta type-3-A [Dunaliella salina]|eukprot:KAF5829927.1 proteasome subunit beta type-3-A [Dunaliella salina]
MSIFEYNGAAIVAMAGKECVAIGSDLRFGVQLQTMTTDCPKAYKIHDKLYIGLSGLGTDAQTFHQQLVFRFRRCACALAESLYGMCESMWRPDMEPEELFETLSQCLLSGVDRDALAGWGAMVHVITKDKVLSRTLKGRMD